MTKIQRIKDLCGQTDTFTCEKGFIIFPGDSSGNIGGQKDRDREKSQTFPGFEQKV